MNFDKSFAKQSKLMQVVLLVVPFVNWLTEILVRWSSALRTKSTLELVIAVLVTIFGVAFGWIDLIWVLLFNKLIGTK